MPDNPIDNNGFLPTLSINLIETIVIRTFTMPTPTVADIAAIADLNLPSGKWWVHSKLRYLFLYKSGKTSTRFL